MRHRLARNVNHLISPADFSKNHARLLKNLARVVATIMIPVDEIGSLKETRGQTARDQIGQIS